jgi:hypothetical protein
MDNDPPSEKDKRSDKRDPPGHMLQDGSGVNHPNMMRARGSMKRDTVKFAAWVIGSWAAINRHRVTNISKLRQS